MTSWKSFASVPTSGTMLERALVGYARRFPISKGKLRVVNALWQVATGGEAARTAALIYGGFKAPCDLREMLQRQLYFFGTYYLERDLLACWGRLSVDARVVFDVDANAGIYSLAALAANSRAVVHAFEPTPEIAERLRKTRALNHLAGLNVQQVAISDRAGFAMLVRCRGGNDNDGMNYIQSDIHPDAEQVPTNTLDAFCLSHGIGQIDLLKLDIQGAEAAALRGASTLLQAGRIRTLFIELNWGNSANCPASQSIEQLEAYGSHFAAPRQELNWKPSGPWLRDHSDIIARSPVEASR
jgi:FkbM family methyltransferase